MGLLKHETVGCAGEKQLSFIGVNLRSHSFSLTASGQKRRTGISDLKNLLKLADRDEGDERDGENLIPDAIHLNQGQGGQAFQISENTLPLAFGL